MHKPCKTVCFNTSNYIELTLSIFQKDFEKSSRTA